MKSNFLLSYRLLLVIIVILSNIVWCEQNTSTRSSTISSTRKENVASSSSSSSEEVVEEESKEKLKGEVEELRERVRNLEEARKTYPKVKFHPLAEQKRILVTGGSGFVGSHLVDRLMLEGHRVTVADNFFTGSKRNIDHWIGHPNFELITHDIVNPLYLEVDEIYHLASPASPPHYMYNPIKTIKTNTMGTINMLGLARRVKARLLFASSSEVYGDPVEHPQRETYWGNVNPIGPRACYDEAKRVAESMCVAYAQQERVQVRIARIFNTYGPRMNLNDGRVVSNFILQSLQAKNITIYGDGEQTRSFQYIDDLVEGLVRLMNSSYARPVNLGNPDEYRIAELAEIVRDLIGNGNPIVQVERVEDDPRRRRPDISVARDQLGWQPKTGLLDGLKKTIGYFKNELDKIRTENNGDHQNETTASLFYAFDDSVSKKKKKQNEEL